MQIYLTDSSGTREITNLIVRSVWSGDESTIARKLSASMLHDETELWPVPSLGDGVTLTHDGALLFAGYVVQRTLDSESSTLEFECYDKGIYLTNNDATYKFRQTTAEAMVRTVCDDLGIPVAELAETGIPLNRKFSGVTIDKLARTAYSLAAEQTGDRYAIRMTPDGLSITVRTQSESSLNLRPRSNLIYGTMERHLQQSESGDVFAQAEALLEDNGLSRNVQVQVLGDTRLITGKTVVVEEQSTGLRGIFWIDSDSHTWQRDTYTCKLTLNCRNVMTTANAGSDLT